MPYVKVELLKGRSTEQKAALARSMTEALFTIAGAKANQCSIVFQDVEPGDWASKGTLYPEPRAEAARGAKTS